jgi:EamA-like transporter family.
MTKSLSMVCAIVTTFIWGTAFIAQDTGMDNIGPLTFNSARFVVGFLTILPLALLFERKKIKFEILSKSKLFIKYLVFMGVSLFLGTFLQQAALQYTNIANAAFYNGILCSYSSNFIIFYLFKKSPH